MDTPKDKRWFLTYDGWDPQAQPLREALCTLGNGYFATRGAAEEVQAGGKHYPGTYLAGGYNRVESEVSGRIIENEDLVNWPNWLCLSFRIGDGPWLGIDSVELLDFQQALDLRAGVLERIIRIRHEDNRKTKLASRRIVSMGQHHLAAIEWTLIPENWSGEIEIRSALDGTVVNDGVERYRKLNGKHLEVVASGQTGEDGVWLEVLSNQSNIRMVQAARTRVFREDDLASVRRHTPDEEGIAQQRLFAECERERPLRVEKTVAIFTSRDFAISHPRIAACNAIAEAEPFGVLLDSHIGEWAHLWNRADITIRDEDSWPQLVLRLHIFHLLQTACFNSIDQDNGVPARGWHGEAYRGHIFWDELFIFPFLDLRMPELTRALLMYRYRRLPQARLAAKASGFRGAMFPWQSGSSGREESQVLHLNPESGRWIPDNTHRQRHINAAIAYNVWQYLQATDDMEFLSFYGAEMLLEIARFWASMASYNAERDRYEIHEVAGPDEFHTRYPGSESHGLNNNAYTNVMAAWSIRAACRAFAWLAEDRKEEVTRKLQLTDDEFQRWETVSRKMFVPFQDDGIISQFEGYEQLEEFDWEAYREKYGDIQRLDRILEAEGDTPNRYKASKQADVLMLFYLFSAEELQDIFEHMHYEFDPQQIIPRNVDYYMARTSHGSTLSRVVHAWVLARSDRQRAWQLFRHALESDITDIQGGTTPEGIHLGAMAGTVDVIQRCHTGLEMRDDVLWFNPCLPEELGGVSQRIRYRGHWLQVDLTREKLTVRFEHGWSGPARIGFQDQVHVFHEGDQREFDLAPPTDAGCSS
ncbi:MAG: glycoside hydrolase family 65 protein [Phycisphaerae bacterium]|nr:glycoside hydrolase family 65 protein [Phycisphaerae bacterium]